MSDYISVSVLNNYLKNIVDAEEMLHNISVVGEISQFKTSGLHAYFAMKDENAEIACTLFNYKMCDYIPKHGETVIASGSVDYYVKGGRLSFKVRKITPLGAGAIALRLEALKKKLLEGGYFDEAHKKPIPKFPTKICVLTAKTGAVIRDIISTARKNNRALDIDVYPVKVQGEGSAETIIDALKTVDTLGYDAIVIARGGGSLEDLMGFNDEKLVYAVYDAVTPIVSAVGHETDFTLCDFAADIRVPTPTAAAELLAFNTRELASALIDTVYGMQRAVRLRFDSLKNAQLHSVRRIASGGRMILYKNRSIIAETAKRICVAEDKRMVAVRNAFSVVSARIEQNNPMKILRQGYSKVYSDGVPVDEALIKAGDGLDIITAAKRIKACVTDVKDNSTGEKS